MRDPIVMCGKFVGSDWLCPGVVCVCVYVHVLELLGVCGVCGMCGDAGKGLRGFDRLSWDETPWNSESVRRLSPSCRLFGLWFFSGGF